MDLTIAQRLICPRGHATTPLVARVDEIVDGRIHRGLLGCPQCNGEWKIAGGVARFGGRATLSAVAGPDAATVAAFLALAEPGLIVCDGVAVRIVDALCRDFGAVVVALDPEELARAATAIDGAERVPLSTASARGAVLLRSQRDASFVASAVAALAPAGRMLAAVTLPVAAGLRELARDGYFWVAEREQQAVPVAIRRRGA